MRKWGILVTVFYALILLLLIEPFAIYIAIPESGIAPGFAGSGLFFLEAEYSPMLTFVIWALLLIAAQALLLFVSVDTSFRRTRPQRHIAASVATVGIAVALLSTLVVFSIGVAIQGDDWLGGTEYDWAGGFWVLMLMFWGLWGLVFHFYKSGSSDKLTAMTRWLIRGSILELLVAVPCHIIVRNREDCSAPIATGYGIATGIAVMLLAFGPSVLFLYQKRLAEYQRKKSAD